MPNADLRLIILIVVANFMLIPFIKIASENEIVPVNRLGKFMKIKGSVLLVRLIGVDKFHKLKIGDRGKYYGNGIGIFDNNHIPLIAESDVKPNSISGNMINL